MNPQWSRLSPRMLLVHPVHEVLRQIPVLIGSLVLGSATGNPMWTIGGIALTRAAGEPVQDTWWRVPQFAAYAAHTRTEEFADALGESFRLSLRIASPSMAPPQPRQEPA